MSYDSSRSFLDDVVDFEHMKKSLLYLADGWCSEKATSQLFGSSITKTSRSLEVKNIAELVESLSESLRVEKLETDCQST